MTSTGMMARMQDSAVVQENQQDALCLTGTGIVAGTDGGVDWKNERMGAGYVTGTALETETSFSASVGGPLNHMSGRLPLKWGSRFQGTVRRTISFYVGRYE
jgi:hypothetical protein